MAEVLPECLEDPETLAPLADKLTEALSQMAPGVPGAPRITSINLTDSTLQEQQTLHQELFPPSHPSLYPYLPDPIIHYLPQSP